MPTLYEGAKKLMLRCRVPARTCFVRFRHDGGWIWKAWSNHVASAGGHREVADDWKVGSPLGQRGRGNLPESRLRRLKRPFMRRHFGVSAPSDEDRTARLGCWRCKDFVDLLMHVRLFFSLLLRLIANDLSFVSSYARCSSCYLRNLHFPLVRPAP